MRRSLRDALAVVVVAIAAALTGLLVASMVNGMVERQRLSAAVAERDRTEREVNAAAARRVDQLSDHVAELTEQVTALRTQLLEAGIRPAVDDPARRQLGPAPAPSPAPAQPGPAPPRPAPRATPTTAPPARPPTCTTVPLVGGCL